MQPKKQFLRAKSVRERYDDIGEVTLWRWVNDPKSKFPKPIKRNGVRYWDIADLDRYDESLKGETTADA
jgi:predicted DNA-binding transcriptional regulator AlpA